MRKICLLLTALVAFSATAAPILVSVKDLNVERSESQLLVSFTLDASAIKLGSDREIKYLPVVSAGSDSTELPAVIIAGRNRYIQNQRHDVTADGTTLSTPGKAIAYSAAVPFRPWMERATVSLVEDQCSCGFDALSSTSADVAMLDFEHPVFTPHFTFVTPPAELNKTREAHGQAYIDFPVNKTDIDPAYRRNPEEIAKIRETIDIVRNDSDTHITDVTITGYASPESPYDNNERLAKGRSLALAEYVRNLYSFAPDIMHAGWVAENWQGLRAEIAASDLDSRDDMLAIIDDSSLDPDARESRIKSLFPDTYKFLLDNVYPGLRRSDYKIDYVVRSYTSVDEIKHVMATAPQKLDLHEIYVVANTLTPGSDEYREAFELAVRMFPDNTDANLNMAAIALQREEYTRAASYLAKAGDSPRAIYARGVLAYKTGNRDEGLRLITDAANRGLAEADDALQQIDRVENAGSGVRLILK